MTTRNRHQLTIQDLASKQDEFNHHLDQMGSNLSRLDILDVGMEEICAYIRAQNVAASEGSSLHGNGGSCHIPISDARSYATRLLKVDFPHFDGSKLKEWLYKCHQFFSIDETSEDTKVRLAAIHFDGIALQWHLNYM